MSETFDAYHKWLGISPKDQPPNHYRLLAIDEFECDPDVIADAAEQRTVHVRSYALGKYTDLSQRILNEIAAAKVCLLNADKKARYDEQLRRELMPTSPPSPIVLSTPGRSDSITTYRSRQKNESWQLVAVVGAAAVLVVVVVAVLLSGGGSDELVESPPHTQRVSHAKVKKLAAPVASAEPKTPVKAQEPPKPAKENLGESSADRPDTDKRGVASKTIPDVKRKEYAGTGTKGSPEAPPERSDPARKEVSETKPPSEIARHLESEKRLNRELAEARTSAEFKQVAEKGLELATQATASGQHDLAERLVVLALFAAREAGDYETAKKATIRFVQVKKSGGVRRSSDE